MLILGLRLSIASFVNRSLEWIRDSFRSLRADMLVEHGYISDPEELMNIIELVPDLRHTKGKQN